MGYRERNRDKIEKLYQDYKNDVYKICRYYTKDEDAAQELAQQTFFSFYQHIDQTNIRCVKAYLIRTARNLSFNYLRDKKHDQYNDSLSTVQGNEATVLSVEEVYIKGEQKRQKMILSNNILEALREENEAWYTAINLAYCLGKPQDVVADEMGISLEVLYSMLYRAKKWIRKNYTGQYEDIVKETK